MKNIKRNFLNKVVFEDLNKAVLGHLFQWYIQGVNGPEDKHKHFVHIFYIDNNISSNHFDILRPLLHKLNIKNLIRIKLNLLTKTNKIIEHEYHQDSSSSNALTSILYLNTNNGYTRFKDKKIKSKANTLITFPSNTFHSGATCTDEEFRLVLNIVYEK
tara:strand:+ start:745 stop:1221 length:477 start_codon:yes stop_codon:yes gene_type:complete